MDFVIIPSNRTSFGLPQVKGRSWIRVFALIQVVYLISYNIVDHGYIRFTMDPFGCGDQCVSSQLTVLVDWFISSISIIVPLITDELLFEDFVYFSYHYIVFIRLFLLYRVIALTLLLPARGLPPTALAIVSALHLFAIMIILRIFYVLLKEIEKSKSSLIAIQLTFTKLGFVSLVKVYRSIEGSNTAVSPPIFASRPASNEVCPICFEPLSIPSNRSTTSLARRRVNASVNRPHIHGKLQIFTTACNHSFHRDCLMKWISGKPIRVDLGPHPEDPGGDGRRLGASCPICGRKVQLRMERKDKFLLEFAWKREL